MALTALEFGAGSGLVGTGSLTFFGLVGVVGAEPVEVEVPFAIVGFSGSVGDSSLGLVSFFPIGETGADCVVSD